MPSAYCQYRFWSAQPFRCGPAAPDSTLSHPTVWTTSATEPSQNGLTQTLRRNTSCGCSGKFCGILLYVDCRSSNSGLIHALPFSTLAMRNFGNRVSVPWQIRLVNMSAISRWPSAVHLKADISNALLVDGGSHLSMYSCKGGWLACNTIGKPASSTSRQNGSNSGSAGERQPLKPYTGAGLISATLAPLSSTYCSSRRALSTSAQLITGVTKRRSA